MCQMCQMTTKNNKQMNDQIKRQQGQHKDYYFFAFDGKPPSAESVQRPCCSIIKLSKKHCHYVVHVVVNILGVTRQQSGSLKASKSGFEGFKVGGRKDEMKRKTSFPFAFHSFIRNFAAEIKERACFYTDG